MTVINVQEYKQQMELDKQFEKMDISLSQDRIMKFFKILICEPIINQELFKDMEEYVSFQIFYQIIVENEEKYKPIIKSIQDYILSEDE